MYAIYARQSIEKKDSISIEMQIELCKSYISDFEKIKVYEDRGYSGTNTKRPAFQEMISDAMSGEIQCIIVYKLDRISRSLADFAALWEEFERKSIELFSYSEGIDTKTPMGQMLIKLLIMFAEMEQKTISGRIRDNYHARAEKMMPLGGVPPFGYRRDWTENRDESIIVKECYNQVIMGKSFDNIGRQMNFSGTKAARIIKNTAYVMCNDRVIEYLVSNGCKLIGKRENFRENYGIISIRSEGEHFIAAGSHIGIIRPEIWLSAQELINGRKPSSNGGSGSKSWLQGLMICGKCGCGCYIRDNGKGKTYRYITCQGRRKGICTGLSSVHLADVESFAEERIVHELEKVLCDMPELIINNENKNNINNVEYEILKDLENSDTISHKKIFKLERQRELLMRKTTKSIVIQQSKKSLWKELPFDSKKAAARLFIKNIIVTEMKIVIILQA